RGRHLPAHHAPAHQRLPLAHLDPGRAHPLHALERRGVVCHACRNSGLFKGKRGLTDNFSNSQVIRKQVVATRGGVVAAQHRRAAEVGAAVLEAGGDAVDAAIATSFAIGVVEPWMSGPAAGGCMVIWRASEAKAYTIDYGMRAPRELDPAGYPLAGSGTNKDLFAWPLVKDNRNVYGATAVAVPGVIAGMGLAHERFARLPWRDLVAPAVALAEQGML